MKKIIKYIGLCFLLLVFACSEESIETDGYGNVTGIVVKKDTNEPIENVKISTNPSSSTVFTNAAGEFSLSSAPSGDYSVEASKDGLLTNFEGVTVTNNQTVSIIFEMVDDTFSNSSPTQPTLLTPNDNEVGLNIEVELTWEATDIDEDDLIYVLELRNDQNSDVFVVENISEASYTLGALNYGVKYFWQIGVSDGVNVTVWSNTWSFTTTSTPIHRHLFVREVNGNDVIFSGTINNEGDPEELQITSSTMNSWRPRRNVTNGLVAFLRSVGAETHLFTMLPDGSEINQVTNAVPVSGFNLGEVDFSWSGSGGKLLYSSFDKLYSINIDGSGLSLVYQTSDGSFISECDWSVDGTIIALKTNNVDGYGASVYTIDMTGTILTTVLTGVTGAVGGLNLSVDNNKLLYTYDVSGFEDATYRQLDTHIFIYDFSLATIEDVSENKPVGFLDVDPRFSPNESEVIFTHTSNDGISERIIQRIQIGLTTSRTILFNDAKMPDWE